jgi:heterodisulfide reductase subunit B
MNTGIKLGYYPGCTLKTKARNLEEAALGALEVLGVEYEELPRWNCCGAVFSLADDDLIHHLAPIRNLIRAKEQGSDTVVTICSQCYNTLARANQLVREDEEKRKTLNLFMTEEPDYEGDVEVMHLLPFLRDHIGWDALKEKVRVPLAGLKVAPFYGCTLVRPQPVAINGPSPEIFQEFLNALGAEPVDWSGSEECCGSYQVIANPEAETERAAKVLRSAHGAGADALVLSCPLCEYNLGTRQPVIREEAEGVDPIPTFYFTQLLAVAFGLEPELCHFELNGADAVKLLKDKELIAAASA